jgi:hypothetical protein
MNITQPQQQLKRAGSRNVPTERKPRDPIPFSTNQMSPETTASGYLSVLFRQENDIRTPTCFVPAGTFRW